MRRSRSNLVKAATSQLDVLVLVISESFPKLNVLGNSQLSAVVSIQICVYRVFELVICVHSIL
jgi:hypothetical protein